MQKRHSWVGQGAVRLYIPSLHLHGFENRSFALADPVLQMPRLVTTHMKHRADGGEDEREAAHPPRTLSLTARRVRRVRREVALVPDHAVDPVCGMTVRTAGAKSAVYDGHAYFFCSQDCRAKFEASPASYMRQRAA